MGRRSDGAPRYTKSTLPEKTCMACGRPFSWRAKWKNVWDEVKTCSERCKGDLRALRRRGVSAPETPR